MSVEDFSTTLACLMRVCWAASAGQLHLVSSSHEEEEGTEGEMQTFKLGICGQNKTVTAKVRLFVLLTSFVIALQYFPQVFIHVVMSLILVLFVGYRYCTRVFGFANYVS